MAYYISSSKVINNSAETIASTQPSSQYPEIQIGTQTWMAKNLDVTHFRDGTPIEDTTADPWSEPGMNDYNQKGYCCDYDNDPLNTPYYGKLYNWYAVNSGVGFNDTDQLAPIGWHIPTYSEWNSLKSYLYVNNPGVTGAQIAGERWMWTKNGTQVLTSSPLFAKYAFNAIPVGFKQVSGSGAQTEDSFAANTYTGYFWTSTGMDGSFDHQAKYFKVEYDSTDIYTSNADKILGYSVRCIKDT